MIRADLKHWLATADASPARWVRSTHRSLLRARARMRTGSVAAEMDRIVDKARDTTAGSGLGESVATRVNRARRRGVTR
ncbi:MAG: hypothetical protein GY812_08155 [Actinomycetia bacterium]|nr:hypothetical protein [Actinomycetes bacterium]